VPGPDYAIARYSTAAQYPGQSFQKASGAPFYMTGGLGAEQVCLMCILKESDDGHSRRICAQLCPNVHEALERRWLGSAARVPADKDKQVRIARQRRFAERGGGACLRCGNAGAVGAADYSGTAMSPSTSCLP
jgi:hypothetical protein